METKIIELKSEKIERHRKELLEKQNMWLSFDRWMRDTVKSIYYLDAEEMSKAYKKIIKYQYKKDYANKSSTRNIR